MSKQLLAHAHVHGGVINTGVCSCVPLCVCECVTINNRAQTIENTRIILERKAKVFHSFYSILCVFSSVLFVFRIRNIL